MVSLVASTGENGELEALLNQVQSLINPYISADPRKEISYDTALYNQEVARSWIQSRGDSVRATWGAP